MKNPFSIAILASFFTSIFLATQSFGAANPLRLVRIDMSEYRSHYTELHQAGIDVAGMSVPKQKVDLIVNAEGLEILHRLGVKSPLAPIELPNRAPDSKFKTPDQVAQILSTFQSQHPDLAQVLSIGKSLEGRDIYAMRITKNVSQPNGGKPTILFNGMHHAREVMATEVPLDIIEYLLTNYGKDAKVTHWVDSDVTYVVPMLNVDGNNMVWTQDNMWRKNTRGGYGVDINRNYPFQWNSCNGSSDSTYADDYRGTGPASEPETNVVMNLVTSIHPVFDISFHSYSELVIYPYGCGQHTDHADVVEPLGQQMASLIPSDSGSGNYTPGLAPDLLYPVDGADIDWMYHEQHVIAFVIELNSMSQGFQPSYDDWRDKTVQAVRPAWQLLLDRLDHSSVRGTVADRRFSRVVVQGSAFQQTYPIHADGSYHAVLNPGDYTLTFSGHDAQPVMKKVHVAQERVSLDVR